MPGRAEVCRSSRALAAACARLQLPTLTHQAQPGTAGHLLRLADQGKYHILLQDKVYLAHIKTSLYLERSINRTEVLINEQ